MAAVGASSEGALPLHLKEYIAKNDSGKMWHIALGPTGLRSRTRIFIGTDVTTLTLDKIRSALATHKWPSVDKWPKPKEVSKRVIILLRPLRPGKTATLQRTAKQGQKYANIFEKAYDGEQYRRAGFLKQPGMVRAALIARLLKLHKSALPNRHTGAPVHLRNGARSTLPRLIGEACPSVLRGPYGNFSLRRDSDGAAALEELKKLLATAVGRDGCHVHVDFMLAFPGQTAQEWHQDGQHSLLAMIVFLTDGEATEFGNYEGKDFMRMSEKDASTFMHKAWKKVTALDHKAQSAGVMAPGDVLRTHTAHIHKAPLPPKVGLRRTIFISFETPGTRCDAEVVNKYTQEGVFANRRPRHAPQPKLPESGQ